MRINSIIFDDTANAPGYSTSVYLQGCPHHCVGCFNPETWDPDGGRDFTYQDIEDILNSLYKNGIKRNLCILGGEPLASYNLFLTNMIITEVKNKYPDVKIYLWTHDLLEDLQKSSNTRIQSILSSIDYLIDGPYEQDKRDLTLFMRGSSNQRVIDMKALENCKKIGYNIYKRKEIVSNG